jgi:hypothetical protein
MSATEPIFMKLALAIQTCVNNYNTKFNENPTNGGVSDTSPQTEKQRYIVSTKSIPFIF